jgi:hypothetical protein
MSISWRKQQRDLFKAQKETHALFAMGVETASEKAQQSGLMDRATAGKLFLFAVYLYKKMAPKKAFDKAFGKDHSHA